MNHPKFLTTNDMKQTQDDALTFDAKQGFTLVRIKTLPLVFAFRSIGGSPAVTLKAYRGRSAKPVFYYRFSTYDKARAYADEFYAKQKASADFFAEKERKEDAARRTLKASDHFMVGDVLYTVWGYDQTNVDFYQVVEVLPKSIRIQKLIANSSDRGGPEGGYKQPVRYAFAKDSKPTLHHLSPSGNVCTGRHGLTKWDGRPKHCSSTH